MHTCKSLTPQGCWEPNPIGRAWWTVGRRIKRVGVRRGWANLRRGVVAAVVLEGGGGSKIELKRAHLVGAIVTVLMQKLKVANDAEHGPGHLREAKLR